MGDYLEGFPSNLSKGEHLVAAAQHIVKLLGAHEYADDHLRKILADLDMKLSAMKLQSDTMSFELNQTRDQLRIAEEKITSWLHNPAIWDSEPDTFSGCLKAITEVQHLMGDIETVSVRENSTSWEMIRVQAENVLHSAMERLELELKDILSQCFLTFEPSVSTPDEEDVDKGSIISAEDELSSGSSCRVSSSSVSEQHYVADIVRPDLVPVIKSIANVMFASNYDQEFHEVFLAGQREDLDNCLIELGIKRFGIEEVTRMGWDQLEGKTKTWVRAVKIFFPVYLAAEKRLCDQIFGQEEVMGPMSPTLFTEIATPSLFTLLSFGQGVVIGPRQPERLFSLLNMYEALSDIQEEMEDMFLDENNSSIMVEWQELSAKLAIAAKATFLEFGDIVLNNPSRIPFPSGGIHPISRYVMNYVKTLEVYTKSLGFLLRDQGPELGLSGSVVEEKSWDDQDDSTRSALASHIRCVVDKLERNLERKSELYRDISLRHLFLLNNIHYIYQKLRGSELQAFVGDQWIREKKVAYCQHAKKYERSSWKAILDLLKREGDSSSSNSNTPPRDQLRSFTAAFEELYRTQTGWLVKDEDLKSELRISITPKLFLAYQDFTTRWKGHNLERYIKYESDDLINLLADLFEGSSKSLSSGYRRM